MNIYCTPGHEVRFTNPDAGYDPDKTMAKELLSLGHTYTIMDKDMRTWHTDVELVEVPGIMFNSAMFEDA